MNKWKTWDFRWLFICSSTKWSIQSKTLYLFFFHYFHTNVYLSDVERFTSMPFMCNKKWCFADTCLLSKNAMVTSIFDIIQKICTVFAAFTHFHFSSLDGLHFRFPNWHRIHTSHLRVQIHIPPKKTQNYSTIFHYIIMGRCISTLKVRKNRIQLLTIDLLDCCAVAGKRVQYTLWKYD